MQREIKFRAKVKGDAKLFKVWKIDWLNLKVELDGGRGNEWTDMEKVTLMQFTGLLDREGKEIYEGDILQQDEYGSIAGPDDKKIISVIKSEMDNSCGCCHMTYGWDIPNNPITLREEWTVIGNVHENPDLLK